MGVVVVAALLVSCVHPGPWRGPREVACEAQSCLDQTDGSVESYEKEGFSLSFVEFSEHGNLIDPAAVALTGTRIRELKADGKKLIVLVYIHGWRHDASPGDGNVRSFRETLRRVARLEQDLAEKRGPDARRRHVRGSTSGGAEL